MLPSIPHGRVFLNRRLTSSERRRSIEKQLSHNVPKRTNIVTTFATLDKSIDVRLYRKVGN